MTDFHESGFHAGALLMYTPSASQVQLSLEGTYHSFDGNLDLPVPLKLNYFAITANAIYAFPGLTMRPFVVGGLGMFNGKTDAPGASGESEFGYNAGGGLRFLLSGFDAVLQVRATVVKDYTFVPITFGLIF
jgi:hypothetical protein